VWANGKGEGTKFKVSHCCTVQRNKSEMKLKPCNADWRKRTQKQIILLLWGILLWHVDENGEISMVFQCILYYAVYNIMHCTKLLVCVCICQSRADFCTLHKPLSRVLWKACGLSIVALHWLQASGRVETEKLTAETATACLLHSICLTQQFLYVNLHWLDADRHLSTCRRNTATVPEAELSRRTPESVDFISLASHWLCRNLLLLLLGSCLSRPDLALGASLDVLLLVLGVDGSLAATTLSGVDKSRRRSRMRRVKGNCRENWMSWRSQSWRVRWGAPCSARGCILCCCRAYLVRSLLRLCRLAVWLRPRTPRGDLASDDREDVLNSALERICGCRSRHSASLLIKCHVNMAT
jgi:hypothetical protein